MRPLLALSNSIDWLNEKLGGVCNWLVLAACVVSAARPIAESHRVQGLDAARGIAMLFVCVSHFGFIWMESRTNRTRARPSRELWA